MRISRDKARAKVERALAETRPEFQSMAWDSAWRAIHALEARGMGDDAKIAQELSDRMRAANRPRKEN